MDKYLVCIDLDSTFLKDDKSISEYAKEYVTRFVNKGNYFIINTGRPHQGAVEFLKELNCPSCNITCDKLFLICHFISRICVLEYGTTNNEKAYPKIIKIPAKIKGARII